MICKEPLVENTRGEIIQKLLFASSLKTMFMNRVFTL